MATRTSTFSEHTYTQKHANNQHQTRNIKINLYMFYVDIARTLAQGTPRSVLSASEKFGNLFYSFLLINRQPIL